MVCQEEDFHFGCRVSLSNYTNAGTVLIATVFHVAS